MEQVECCPSVVLELAHFWPSEAKVLLLSLELLLAVMEVLVAKPAFADLAMAGTRALMASGPEED